MPETENLLKTGIAETVAAKPKDTGQKQEKRPSTAKDLINALQSMSFRSLIEILEPLRIQTNFPASPHADYPDCHDTSRKITVRTEVGIQSILKEVQENRESFLSSLHAEGLRAIELNGIDGGALSILNPGLIEKEFSRKLGPIQKRLDHAVKTLKRKKISAEDEAALYRLAEQTNDKIVTAAMEYLHVAMPALPVLVSNLDEPVWRQAIELSVLFHDSDLFDNPEQYLGVFVEAHASEIRLLALLLGWLKTFSSVLIDVVYWATDMDAACSICGGLEGLVAGLGFVANQSCREMNALKQTYAKKMEDQKDLHTKQAAELLAKIHKLERGVLPGTGEIESLKARIAELETALAERDTEIEGLLDDSYDEEEHDLTGIPELPATGIALVGGHPNLVKRLKGLFPGWNFIDAGRKGAVSVGTPDILCIRTEHLCHPVFRKAMAQRPSGCPVIYSSTTNPEKFIEELRYKIHQEVMKNA